MSTTQQSTGYSMSGAVQCITAGGTQANGSFVLTVTPGTDFTDADAFAIQEAILAAFPESWAVANDDMAIQKQADALTQYTTDYTTKTFT